LVLALLDGTDEDHRSDQMEKGMTWDIGKSFGVFSLLDDEDVLQGTAKLRRSSRKKKVGG